MKKVWSAVIFIVIALLLVGVALVAVGMFTGGSLDRIISQLYGSWDAFWRYIYSLPRQIFELFPFVK